MTPSLKTLIIADFIVLIALIASNSVMPINPISSPFINFIDLLQSSLLHAEFVSSLLLRCIVHQYDKNVAGRGALHFISEVLDFWRVPETKACTKSEFHTHTLLTTSNKLSDIWPALEHNGKSLKNGKWIMKSRTSETRLNWLSHTSKKRKQNGKHQFRWRFSTTCKGWKCKFYYHFSISFIFASVCLVVVEKKRNSSEMMERTPPPPLAGGVMLIT